MQVMKDELEGKVNASKIMRVKECDYLVKLDKSEQAIKALVNNPILLNNTNGGGNPLETSRRKSVPKGKNQPQPKMPSRDAPSRKRENRKEKNMQPFHPRGKYSKQSPTCYFCSRSGHIRFFAHQMAPKRSKTKGKCRRVDEHSLRNASYAAHLQNILTRTIHPGKAIDLKDVGGWDIRRQVDGMGWNKFITKPRGSANVSIVRDFYASMIYSEFLKGRSVRVREVDVFIQHQEINEYYRTMPHDDLPDELSKNNIFRPYDSTLDFQRVDRAPRCRASPTIGVKEETKTTALVTGGGEDSDDEDDPGAVPITAADPAAE
ncbi:hypothetical protein LWI28_013921 [Acer negundo]|uniref:Uncharacterized protein n=1 Tax=Acer negundo TaxID=4023 RepID=A0AAD5NND0_ACENE|nr:hypothetical protein LWI28_013921 [Acer negundo]